MNPIELRQIKVKIYRDIRGRVPTNIFRRDIPNKEDVVLKRRTGEGSKPIFDREEIKRGIGGTEEVEEHRTVVTVNLENSGNKLKSLKRRSASLSPTRTRNHSGRRTSSRHPRFEVSSGTTWNPVELRKCKVVDIHRNISGRVATNEVKRDIPNKEDVVLKRRTGEGSKPIFDREGINRGIGETEEVEEHRTVVSVNLENSENKLKSLKRRSASLSPTRTRNHSGRWTSSRHPRYDDSKHEDKGSYRSDKENDHSRERKNGERSYRDHRERPRYHSRDRRQTDRSREREQRVPPEHFIEPIPIPNYYGNFQPRSLMIQPWCPIREPFGGNIHPPMMRPLRTFPSQSIGIPTHMYGFRPPLNPTRNFKR